VVRFIEFKQVRQMSANAITLLNFAGVNFSGRDYRNVHINGANLNNAILQGADFAFANLENIQLQRSCLVDANFQGSNLRGVSFGQQANIVHGKDPYDPYHSEAFEVDGQTYPSYRMFLRKFCNKRYKLFRYKN